MRKFTFLSVLLLLLGWGNAWAQAGLLTPDQLSDGKMVAIKAIDANNSNWISVVKAGSQTYNPGDHAFKLVYNEEGTSFALCNVKQGEEGYVQKATTQNTPHPASFGPKETAAWFTAKSINYTGGGLAAGITGTAPTTIRLTTYLNGNGAETYFNVNDSQSRAKFHNGTGGYSIVHLYEVGVVNAKSPITDAAALQEGQDYLIKGVGGRPGWAFAGVAGAEQELLKVFLNNTSDAVTTLSEKYVFRIEGTSDSFKLKTKDGKYVQVPDLVDSSDNATVFTLTAKPGAAAGVWNLKMPGTYANMNPASNVTNPPADANFVITPWNDEGDVNGKWEIYPVNTLVPEYTVTYYIKDSHGNVVNTQTYQVLEGDPFPPVQYGASAPEFFDASGIPEGTVSGDGEYDVTITSLPFYVSTMEHGFDNNTKWHMLTIRGSKQPTYDVSTGEIRNQPSAAEPNVNNVFAFTGDPFNGFHIYNAAAGEDKRLHSTNTNNQHCTFTAEGATFGLYHNTASGYQFKLVGTANSHLNDLGGGNTANPLGVWTDSGSATDDGGTFTFSDVVDLPVHTLVYHVKDADGNVIDTQTRHVVTGTRFPSVRGAVSGREFFDIPEGTVEADGEYDVAMKTADLPFKPTTMVENYFADDTQWYTLTVGDRHSAYNATTGKVDNSKSSPTDINANHVFAFTGDLFHGFRIYNAAVGTDKSLHSTNTNNQQCTFTTAGATFGLYRNTESGYQFKLADTYTAYLNDAGGDAEEANQLKIVTAASAATSEGSTFTFVPASPAVCNVTYHLKYNAADAEDLNTQSHSVVVGAPFPTVRLGVSASTFFNTDAIPSTPVTAAGDYTVTIKGLPFEVSTVGEYFDSNTKWYTLKIRSNKHLVYNSTTGKVSNTTTAPDGNDAYNVFAFTGDPFHGFKICNGAVGADKRLYVTDTDGQHCTFTIEGTTFGLYKNNTDGYQFKLVGSDVTHLNDISNNLGVWKDSRSARDDGSTFTFAKVEMDLYTVTYHFVDSEGNSVGLKDQTRYFVKGAPHAVRAASGPTFFTLPSEAVSGNMETCNVTVKGLPFTASTIGEHFDSATQWYKMTVRDKNTSYNAVSGEIDITAATAEDNSVNSHNVFAFTGNLIDGFRIYNAAAGSGKKLYVTKANNDRCTFTEDGTVFGLYEHGEKYLFKLTNADYAYLHDITANGVLSVWNASAAATDDGSKFTFTKVVFDATGAAAIAKENLREIVEALEPQLGTDPGYYANTEENIAKINAAKAVLDNSSATEEDVNDQISRLGEIMQAGFIMPEAGKFYQFISAYAGFETHANGNRQKKAMYSDGAFVKWGTLVAEPEEGTLAGDDRKQIWTIEPTEDGSGYVVRNYVDGKYPAAPTPQNQNIPVGTEKIVATIHYLDVSGQFNIRFGNNVPAAHAGGHNNGAGTGGNIVTFNANGASNCSSWYIHEVKEPAVGQRIMHDVAYNYTVDGEAKRVVMGTYDEVTPTALPFTPSDFVTVGELAIDWENKTVTVPCTYHDIPFTYSDSYLHVTTWYAIDMHSNYGAHTWTYVADADDNVQLPVTSNYDLKGGYMPAERRWAFVGDPLNGFKIYNQAAGSGMTLRKEADGNVVSCMSDINDQNLFFLYGTVGSNSKPPIENSFAWKLADDTDYLNHNLLNNLLQGWNSPDESSSCRVYALDLTADIRKNAFYRIKGGGDHYIGAGTPGSSHQVPMVADASGAETIYYFDGDRRLLNYSNGLYIYQTYATANVSDVDQADTWAVVQNGDKLIFIADDRGFSRYLYDGGNSINRNSVDNADHCRWTVERVEELPVTVSGAARWGTFCAPVSLDIPAGVEVYYASGTDSEENYIYMTQLMGGVIPAGLPILFSNVNDATAGTDNKTYNFPIHRDDVAAVTDQNPQWLGTPAGKISVPSKTTYMLSLQNGKVAFRKNATTVVRGFKAYLQPANTAAESLSIRFDEFVTGMPGVKAEDTGKTEYYDLSGRRVYFPTRGFYVTNRGEKVFIK